MVKNTKGGSGHKGQARKFVAPKSSYKTRMATEEGEMYAYVTNKSGGENCLVICQDDILRRCVIRGKFRSSRGKRDNFITKGSWVLVGIRDWASIEKPICDLLEVYNESDKLRLKTIPNINWMKFMSHDLECSSKVSSSAAAAETELGDTFEFSNSTAEEEEYQKMVDSCKSTMTLQPIHDTDDVEEDINIDDI
jgi:translation initiation factor IF-1